MEDTAVRDRWAPSAVVVVGFLVGFGANLLVRQLAGWEASMGTGDVVAGAGLYVLFGASWTARERDRRPGERAALVQGVLGACVTAAVLAAAFLALAGPRITFPVPVAIALIVAGLVLLSAMEPRRPARPASS